jgi:NADH:ubiquinone oxidoreductase subunit 3 (subunit A)
VGFEAGINQPRREGKIMSVVFNMLAVLFMVAVVAVLLRGLMVMMKGGSGNTSNKLMQARVFLQFIALVLIMVAYWFSQRGS